ncbi:MAG: hypothetical protein RLZ98_850 [Pseudomonadota bacterium]|jgi:flavin-binding protein dodecin
MSDGTEFTGSSPTGDIQDALNQAIFKAMGTLESEAVEWTLLKVSGVTAGVGYRSRTVVTISAKKAG